MAARIDNIQALRGVAASMVLATHVMTMERKYSHSGRLLPDWFEVGTSGVDLFFVISGFIMVHITHGWFRRPQAVREFLFNRVTRIYPLYWLYSLLVLAVYLLRPQWVNASQGHEANLLASFLLLPSEKLPLLQLGWSLIYEMYFYGVFAGLLLLRERFAPAAVAAWAVAVAVAYFVLGPFRSPLLAVVTSPYCLEFALGALVAFLVGRGVTLPRPLLLPALLGMAAAWLASIHFFHSGPTPPWRVLVYGIPYPFFAYALVSCELRGGFTSPAWLVCIGDASYSLYLSHFLLISAMGRLWSAFDFGGRVDNAVVILAMVLAALLWARASFAFIERPLLRFAARLRGRLRLAGAAGDARVPAEANP